MDFRTIISFTVLALVLFMPFYLIRKKPWEAFQSAPRKKIARFGLFSAMAYIPLAIGGLIWWGKRGDPLFNFLTGLVFAFFFTLLTLFLFFIVSDLVALTRKSIRLAATGASPATPNVGRRRVVRQLGIGLAAAPFFSFLYGITKGKYDFTVRKVRLSFPDLPAAFDGFRIAQISDVHSGSFDDLAEVRRGVQMIQQQSPDLLLFTGDFVNERAEEADAIAPFFNELSMPFGKFAVLGNHDYGFGRTFRTQADLDQNHLAVQQKYADAGFRLLKNEQVRLEKDGEHIHLIGVENWGKPPFPQKGDLAKAAAGIDDNAFKILMSHDPTHWDAHVLPFPQQIHLTLSGHTHGMQMGIDIPWLKMSLVKFVYPRWMDLYQEANRYLYVNRGFGWLGMPARVGIFPEITVFELKRAAT